MEILDPGRKRHDEYKELANEYDEAQSLSDLLKPYKQSMPISIDKVTEEVGEALYEKSKKYGDVHFPRFSGHTERLG